ncbi:MAG TPA: glycosyltransferase family 2 protein, partial [Desulfobacterales bacterium]|nr:glycosyltransferase family 2 protein [Desulfobacterales bacterium]
MMVDFSVCATTYNNAGRLKVCLDSIIKALVDLDFEVVIVDNYSTDGSQEIIWDYAHRYANIKVLRCSCSRGLGRQLAFENSSGRHIITIDTDTEYYSEKLHKILVSYKQGKLGEMTAVHFWGSLGIYPRPLVEKAGGWRDYNVGEDNDFLARLSKVGHLVFLPINIEMNEPYEEWPTKGLIAALRFGTIAREKRY